MAPIKDWASVADYRQFSSSRPCSGSIKQDWNYVLSLLDYGGFRVTVRTCCWPNHSTFTSMFQTLSIIAPGHLGERAESLLSREEMRNPASSSSNPSHISLVIYHRVFSCWANAADKNKSFGKALQRPMFLLEQLEIQDFRAASNETLYDIELRPAMRTYKLTLSTEQRRTGRNWWTHWFGKLPSATSLNTAKRKHKGCYGSQQWCLTVTELSRTAQISSPAGPQIYKAQTGTQKSSGRILDICTCTRKTFCERSLILRASFACSDRTKPDSLVTKNRLWA